MEDGRKRRAYTDNQTGERPLSKAQYMKDFLKTGMAALRQFVVENDLLYSILLVVREYCENAPREFWPTTKFVILKFRIDYIAVANECWYIPHMFPSGTAYTRPPSTPTHSLQSTTPPKKCYYTTIAHASSLKGSDISPIDILKTSTMDWNKVL